VNREVRSSVGSNLVTQLITNPGQFVVKHNPPDEINEALQLNKDCVDCRGIGLVTSFEPSTYLTNNPEPIVTNPVFCCNQEYKALQNVIYADTNLKKNYFTTTSQYLQNRCQTYTQKAFNFRTPADIFQNYNAFINNPAITAAEIKNAKPGSPLTLLNTYVGNCFPNTSDIPNSQYGLVLKVFEYLKNGNVLTQTDIQNFYSEQIQNLSELNTFLTTIQGNKIEALQIYTNVINNPYIGVSISGPSNSRGCKLVVYKPSNPQFAVQGGVSSSTRTMKLTVDTIGTNVANIRKLQGNGNVNIINNNPYIPFVYKNKVPPCYTSTYAGVYQNPKTCFKNALDYQYKAISKLGNIGNNINGTQVSQVGMGGSRS
jgi:hypothetical protein